jgi:hypothetical protein
MMRSWRSSALLLAMFASVAAAYDDPLRVSEDQGPPPPLPLASPISDHFALDAGFFWGNVGTIGQFNSGTIIGTPLSAEKDLGLTNQAYQPRFQIYFRLRPRHRLRVNFFDLRRNGEQQTVTPIQFGNQTFQANEPLQSSVSWRQMDLTYTYSFLRGERYELGAGLGVHLIEAEAIGQVPGTPQRADYSEAGPFATLALDGTFLIDRHWSLNARGQYFRITVNSFTGMMQDYRADLQYRWRRNLAFGAGYEYYKAEVDARNSNPSGVIDLWIRGPQLFVRASF